MIDEDTQGLLSPLILPHPCLEKRSKQNGKEKNHFMASLFRVSIIKALRMISMIIGGIMTVVRVCESPRVELKSVNYQVTPVTKSQLEFGE